MLAWILAGLLALTALAGFLTFLIGIYVLPEGVLLLAGLAFSESARRYRVTAPALPH